MKKMITLFMVGLVCMGLSGCTGNAGDKAYSITMDGAEVIVGETTVSVERHASIGINVRLFSPSYEQKTTRYYRDYMLLPECNRFSSTA